MSDERLKDLYAGATRRNDAGCSIGPEAMMAVIEKRGTAAERQATLAAISSNPRCREEFDLLRALVDAAGDAPARARTRRFSISHSATRTWLAAAATVVLVLSGGLLWRRASGPSDVVERGGESSVTTIAPHEGDQVKGDVRLVWHAVPATVRYEVSVVDSLGGSMATMVTTDTALTVAPGRLEAGEHRWWVRAVDRSGAVTRSTTARFRLSR